jgi:hypothetical protein
VQSQDGEIVLLPALPSVMANGSFKGLCVRVGAEIDATWSDIEVCRSSQRHPTLIFFTSVGHPLFLSYKFKLIFHWKLVLWENNHYFCDVISFE